MFNIRDCIASSQTVLKNGNDLYDKKPSSFIHSHLSSCHFQEYLTPDGKIKVLTQKVANTLPFKLPTDCVPVSSTLSTTWSLTILITFIVQTRE
jgi:hypothetical protein